MVDTFKDARQGFTLMELMIVLGIMSITLMSVSYTHLTLPTIYSV